MGTYKVGDVAALFSTPKDPTTEGGKKLQSLFQDFYGKQGKSPFQPSQHNGTSDLDKESKEAEDQKMSKKNRKRKFSSANELEANDESKKSFKKMKPANDAEENKSFKTNENKKSNQFSKQKDFPRKKNKKPNINIGCNSNYSFPKFEEKFDSEKVFGGLTLSKDNQNGKQKFNSAKKSKRQSLESGNDSFTHIQNKFSEDVSDKDLIDNSSGNFKPKKDKKSGKQNLNFIKKSKQQNLESGNDSFTHNQNKFSGNVSDKDLVTVKNSGNFKPEKDKESGKQNLNFIKKSKRQSLEYGSNSFTHNQNESYEIASGKDLADNNFDSPKPKKGKKNGKQNLNFIKTSKQQSLEMVNDSFSQNKLSDETSNIASKDNSFGEFKSKKNRKNKKQNKNKNLESESDNHNQNKLSGEAPDEGDSSLKSEIQEFMKNNSKKFKNNENDFVPKSPPKVFNQRKNFTYSFKRKFEPDVQSNVVDSPATEIKNDAPARQVADFIRNPKKRSKDNKPENCKSLKETDEALNKETTDDSDVLFQCETDENDCDEPVFKKKKFGDNYLKEKARALTAGLSRPDFIKIPNATRNDEETLGRTLFVGNLPVNTSKKALNKLFSVFGIVEYVRFYGVETNKAKIFSKDSSKPLNANYASDSLPGFIVFKERKSATEALSLNGTVFKGHHITVDFALPPGTKKMYDEKRSIFIGNLPFSTTDESIWNTFSQCGTIESVRVVRDKATGVGKGFGYVLFSTEESRKNALALENVEIEGRTIRIKPVDSNKKTQKNSNSPVVKRDSFKSRAIKFKRNNKDASSRKSINKIMKKQKNIHNKKKIASILQKSMK